MDHVFLDIADAETLARARQSCRSDIPSDIYGLSPSERLAIWLWSTSAYPLAELNRQLRTGAILTDPQQSFCTLLARALSRIPPTKAEWVYRGVATGRSADFIRSHFAGGAVHTWRSFVSATLDPDQAYVGDLLMVIQPLSARPIMLYAEDPLEQEVLFKPGSRFLREGAWIGTNRYVVQLREVV